ncbi:hypothetical protein F2Q69_00025612 [Brassica cretica]|uniref:Uncharacterized protein n=1 Tax=Brassica cretica TaxID=69181 RepID=A0A8S9RZZ7_BRACR|nr:hypothetical protein F2Q69_00025612 [Brassica cretica]
MIEIWGMDPCCWMCVSLNKNSGWRWIDMGFGLLDVYHSQDKSMGGMEVKNRHKLGGLELDKTRLLSLFLTGKRLRFSEFARQNYFIKGMAKIANYK